MRRALGCVAALSIVFVLSPLLLAIALAVKLTSRGPVLHWSTRVGYKNITFRMPKFRTMKLDTPDVATHLLTDPELHLTSIGGVLRKFSLDELPQLWSIVTGELTFVGPRPALHNQDDLIALRTANGVHLLVPGITGWAQVNGRDKLSVPEKVQFDEYYLEHRSLLLDLKIIAMTVINAARGDGVKH
jgi:O-antigen biosynthesis protein WbqP